MSAAVEHARRARLLGSVMLLLALLAVPVLAQQGKPSGAEVWSANCGRCHRLRAVDAYTSSQWEAVVAHMSLTARLTPDETDAVREFLVGAARAREAVSRARESGPRPVVTLASSDVKAFMLSGAECCDPAAGSSIYKAQCVACHGQRGRGDGPAAVALNPKPSNLADAARMTAISDDSLVQVVTQGRKTMPGFGKTLSPDEVREVVAYLRSLKQ